MRFTRAAIGDIAGSRVDDCHRRETRSFDSKYLRSDEALPFGLRDATASCCWPPASAWSATRGWPNC